MATYFDPLQPLKYFDVSRFYDSYASSVDLIIFFMFFMGLTYVTLGKRFEGRGGTMLCVALSLALSIGMMIFERETGFNLKTFGAVGAGLFVLLVGVLVFMTFKHLEFSKPLSFSLAFLILFFGINSVSPQMFSWFLEKFPTLALLFTICFFIALFIVLSKLISIIKGQGFSLPFKFSKDKLAAPNVDAPGKMELKQEKKGAKEIRSDIGDEIDDTKTINHGLKHLINIIRKHGLDDEVQRKHAIRSVNEILKAEHDIEIKMKDISNLMVKQEASSDPEINKACQEMKKLFKVAVELIQTFRYYLREGIAATHKKLSGVAINFFEKAKKYEKELHIMLGFLEKNEKRILRLIKRAKRRLKSNTR